MFGENDRISQRQLGRQSVLLFLGLFVIIMPSIPNMRGRSGVVSCILGTLCAFIYLFFLGRISGAYRNPEKIVGKFLSRVLILLYSIYLIFTAAFVVRVLTEMVSKYLITGTSKWIIAAAIVLVSGWGTGWNLQRRGRIAEISYNFIVGGFVLFLLLAAFQIPSDSLKVVEPLETNTVLRGVWQYFAAFATVAVIPFITERVERSASAGKRLIKSIGIVSLLTIACLLVLQAAFGVRGIAFRELPILDLMSGVNVSGEFLQRIDIIWMSILIFCLLFSAGSLLFYTNHLLEKVNRPNWRGLVAGIVFLVSCLGYQGMTIIDIYGPALVYICAPVLLVLSLCMALMHKRRNA